MLNFNSKLSLKSSFATQVSNPATMAEEGTWWTLKNYEIEKGNKNDYGIMELLMSTNEKGDFFHHEERCISYFNKVLESPMNDREFVNEPIGPKPYSTARRPIHWAIYRNYKKLARYLVSMGADVRQTAKLKNGLNEDDKPFRVGNEQFLPCMDAEGYVKYFGNPQMNESHVWRKGETEIKKWKAEWMEILRGEIPWTSREGDNSYDKAHDPDPKVGKKPVSWIRNSNPQQPPDPQQQAAPAPAWAPPASARASAWAPAPASAPPPASAPAPASDPASGWVPAQENVPAMFLRGPWGWVPPPYGPPAAAPAAAPAASASPPASAPASDWVPAPGWAPEATDGPSAPPHWPPAAAPAAARGNQYQQRTEQQKGKNGGWDDEEDDSKGKSKGGKTGRNVEGDEARRIARATMNDLNKIMRDPPSGDDWGDSAAAPAAAPTGASAPASAPASAAASPPAAAAANKAAPKAAPTQLRQDGLAQPQQPPAPGDLQVRGFSLDEWLGWINENLNHLRKENAELKEENAELKDANKKFQDILGGIFDKVDELTEDVQQLRRLALNSTKEENSSDWWYSSRQHD